MMTLAPIVTVVTDLAADSFHNHSLISHQSRYCLLHIPISFYISYFIFYPSTRILNSSPPRPPLRHKNRYLGNQEWYHRSAGVKTTGKTGQIINCV